MARPQAQTTQIKEEDFSDSRADKVTKSTGEILKEQETVKVKIPLSATKLRELQALEDAGKEPKWPAEDVWVNGYRYTIIRGKTVEVPQTVAEILEQAGLI